jgi:hypothetical protein
MLLTGATAVFLGCQEPPPLGVEPRAPAPQVDLVSSTLEEVGLLTFSPLPSDSVTQTIGPEGGILYVGAHALSVPAGALDSAVTITAVAPSDTVNLVGFEPEGLVFQKAASLIMSYANCDLLGSTLPKRIAHVDDELAILYYLISVDDPTTQTVTGRLEHFSEYALAW